MATVTSRSQDSENEGKPACAVVSGLLQHERGEVKKRSGEKGSSTISPQKESYRKKKRGRNQKKKNVKNVMKRGEGMGKRSVVKAHERGKKRNGRFGGLPS